LQTNNCANSIILGIGNILNSIFISFWSD